MQGANLRGGLLPECTNRILTKRKLEQKWNTHGREPAVDSRLFDVDSLLLSCECNGENTARRRCLVRPHLRHPARICRGWWCYVNSARKFPIVPVEKSPSPKNDAPTTTNGRHLAGRSFRGFLSFISVGFCGTARSGQGRAGFARRSGPLTRGPFCKLSGERKGADRPLS